MTCKHENHTIDLVCNSCGYDLIVDSLAEKIRKAELYRIISKVEKIWLDEDCSNHDYARWCHAADFMDKILTELNEDAALIKGEQK